MEQVLSVYAHLSDDESTLRPTTLKEYVGQT